MKKWAVPAYIRGFDSFKPPMSRFCFSKKKLSDIYSEIRSSGFQSGKRLHFLRSRRRNRLSRARSWKSKTPTTPSIRCPPWFPSLKSSEPAILPTQTCWNRKMHGSADRKMGLQAKERRAKITILPCSFRVSRLFYPLFGDIWVMGPQKICKTRFRTVTDRLSWW